MRSQNNPRRMLVGIAAAAASLALAACGSGSDAQSGADTDSGDGDQSEQAPADYFAGKTITLIVPYNPGGGFDTFVRLIGPRLEEEMGNGTKVHVVNRPGGGGLVGANEVFQAEPDGLTLGLVNYPGAVFAEASETEGVEFSNTEWTFMARLGAINPIVYTSAESGYTDFQSMIDAEDEISFGIGGAGSDAYYATAIMSEILGFPAEIIAGYPGGAEADAALLVGEVEAGVNSVDAALTRIEGTDTNINAVISTEANPNVPDVPLITEFGDDGQQEILTALASIYDLERILVGPPGIDDERADFLADAIYSAATSDAYVSEMSEAGLTASALERADVLTRAEAVTNSIDELTPYVQSATN